MRWQGIASCGKHFPGYSAATVDAHHELPQINRTREELDSEELAVFHQFVDKIDSMMICHGWYPCLEPKRTPETLSRRVVTQLLREEMAVHGLIMTVDLDMRAIFHKCGLVEPIRVQCAAGMCL